MLTGAALAVAEAERPAADPGRAVPLHPGGPYAVADGDALAALMDPDPPDAQILARAVRGSTLPQLDVWDERDPGVWLQQGTGPLVRRFDGRPPTERTRPTSIVVRCDAPAHYRWTITGTAPGASDTTRLATGGAACGPTPTVATSLRLRGSVVRGFDLAIPAGTRWGMLFVFPADG